MGFDNPFAKPEAASMSRHGADMSYCNIVYIPRRMITTIPHVIVLRAVSMRFSPDHGDTRLQALRGFAVAAFGNSERPRPFDQLTLQDGSTTGGASADAS